MKYRHSAQRHRLIAARVQLAKLTSSVSCKRRTQPFEASLPGTKGYLQTRFFLLETYDNVFNPQKEIFLVTELSTVQQVNFEKEDGSADQNANAAAAASSDSKPSTTAEGVKAEEKASAAGLEAGIAWPAPSENAAWERPARSQPWHGTSFCWSHKSQVAACCKP